MKKILSFIGVAATAVSFMASSASAEELKLGGGAPPIIKAINPVKDAFQKKTGIVIAAKSYGPKFAIIDLAKGEIEGAVLFLKKEEVAEMVKQEGIKLDVSTLQQADIGKDVVKIIVNSKNPVKAITSEQAKGIFSGKITNWKEVGGNDAPIIVVFSESVKGINDLFTKYIMKDAKFTKEVLDAPNAKEVSVAVSTNAEAIALSAAGSVYDGIKALEQPEISVPIIIFTKGQPSPAMQKLVDFIKAGAPK